MTEINKLEEWYAWQCDGSWEHQYGISISTLDNPGWSLKIDLANTDLIDRAFTDIKIDRSKDDWVVARRSKDIFEAFGGTKNLKEMIRVFLDWA